MTGIHYQTGRRVIGARHRACAGSLVLGWQVTCLDAPMLWLRGKLPFKRRPYGVILLFSLALGLTLPEPAIGQPTTDSSAAEGRQVGKMIVAVTFGGDGKVQKCRLLRSNAPFQIELSTIDHIRKHWDCPVFAGDTEVLPIVFDDTSTSVPWDGDLEKPPLFYPDDDKTYSLKVRITFGNDGWANRVQIVQPSGIQLADRQTAEWLQIHWHHDAYANEVIDAPFEFSRPLPPPPPAPPPPVKRAPPEQPVAIPAIRVQ